MPAPEEIAAQQRAFEPDFPTGLGLVVEIVRAQEGLVVVIEVDTQLQLAFQEPGLDECQLVILALGAQRSPAAGVSGRRPEPGRLDG